MSGAWPPPGEQPPPPPGQWPAPGTPQPQQPPPYAGFGQPPGYPPPFQPLPPAHKPGAIPLRPLTLGEILDGAFKLVRFNPGATVGASVLVSAVSMAVPVLVTVVATIVNGGIGNVTFSGSGTFKGPDTSDVISMVLSFGSFAVGSILQQFGKLLVAGMIAHVAHAAAVGRRITLGAAWAATYGKRWRLVGLAAVVGLGYLLALLVLATPVLLLAFAVSSPVPAILVGILLLVAYLIMSAFFYIRLVYISVPALMLEQVGIFGALGRSWRLTRAQFWRTFGIALLATLLGAVVSGVIGVPVSLVQNVVGLAAQDYVLLIDIIGEAVSVVLGSALVIPFTTAVANLQYLDQRMRKESYEVELMEQAGLLSR